MLHRNDLAEVTFVTAMDFPLLSISSYWMHNLFLLLLFQVFTCLFFFFLFLSDFLFPLFTLSFYPHLEQSYILSAFLCLFVVRIAQCQVWNPCPCLQCCAQVPGCITLTSPPLSSLGGQTWLIDLSPSAEDVQVFFPHQSWHWLLRIHTEDSHPNLASWKIGLHLKVKKIAAFESVMSWMRLLKALPRCGKRKFCI